jgi:hypothetical protein
MERTRNRVENRSSAVRRSSEAIDHASEEAGADGHGRRGLLAVHARARRNAVIGTEEHDDAARAVESHDLAPHRLLHAAAGE